MQKIAVTFLVTVFLCGLASFLIGRPNYKEVKGLADTISTEHRKAESAISSIRDRLDGLTETASTIATRSQTIADRSGSAAGRIEEVRGGLEKVKTTVDRIEYRHRQTVGIISQNRDLDFEFRRLLKEIQGEE